MYVEVTFVQEKPEINQRVQAVKFLSVLKKTQDDVSSARGAKGLKLAFHLSSVRI